jgi:hypothetical protein
MAEVDTYGLVCVVKYCNVVFDVTKFHAFESCGSWKDDANYRKTCIKINFTKRNMSLCEICLQ